jgi:hypothetical protein
MPFSGSSSGRKIDEKIGLDHGVGHLVSMTPPRLSASRHRKELQQKSDLAILSQAFFPCPWLEEEVAVGTGIQYPQRSKEDRYQRWDRIERAEQCERYGDRKAQGMSQRQAAKGLEVPRSMLQAWRTYQERLDACPAVVAFFHSVPGLAFLHRLVLAIHLVCTAVGACGMRLVCLLLKLTGLNRFVGASYGTPQQVNRCVEEAIVAYRHEESARLGHAMPAKAITMTQDATFTGGLCVVGIKPISHDIVLAQAAQARDHDPWQDCMAQALAGRNCQVIQATSDEAPGLLAYVEHHLGAYPSPDVFHGQHELSKAVSAPMAVKQRAAAKAVAQAAETLKQGHESLAHVNSTPEKRAVLSTIMWQKLP